jgi:hypothetical protein
MKREWRVLGTFPFALDDVCRVILPSFRETIPGGHSRILQT